VRRRGRSAAGFTIVELLFSLLVIGFALALAAQLLMETSQMMVDVAGEQTETSLPLARARLRADVQACRQAQVVPEDGRFELWLLGHPAGTVRYRKVGRELLRDVSTSPGVWTAETVALRNVQGWSALPASALGLVAVEIHTLRRAVRRSSLPAVPGTGAPGDQERVETLVAVPRGGGLGWGW
jgi:type II secretory pathway pseudopilin PulG